MCKIGLHTSKIVYATFSARKMIIKLCTFLFIVNYANLKYFTFIQIGENWLNRVKQDSLIVQYSKLQKEVFTKPNFVEV